MDKILEIIDKGNTRHRLTVTPTRISIKYSKDSDETERAYIYKNFMRISGLLSGVEYTLRGQVRPAPDNNKIVMYNELKTDSQSFKFE